MRRVFPVLLGTLAFLALTTAGEVLAQTTTTSTTTPPTTTTTTTPPVLATTSTTGSTSTTTTTVRSTSTTAAGGGRPALPPPAGPYQTLVPDLLGAPVTIETTTTNPPLEGFAPALPAPTIPNRTATASISSRKTSPSGATLALAAVAWLASLGGVLVYAEDRRASRWRHLARD